MQLLKLAVRKQAELHSLKMVSGDVPVNHESTESFWQNIVSGCCVVFIIMSTFLKRAEPRTTYVHDCYIVLVFANELYWAVQELSNVAYYL